MTPRLATSQAFGITILCAFASWLACRSPTAMNASEDLPLEALRFPHQSHTEVACTRCHVAVTESAPTTQPGHASCDAPGCHQVAFTGAPTELCALCHEGISTEAGAASPLMTFPPGSGMRSQPSNFSHAQHLNASRMEAALGFHISCTDCHELQKDSGIGPTLRSPRHADCARCHATEAAVPGTPAMTDCVGCHLASASSLPRHRDFITGDLHFDHRAHLRDRRGIPISCLECHNRSAVATRSEIGKHATPEMRACVDCHDNSERVPQAKRMRRCETCHSTRSAGLRALAPRSHMPATERPANHTQAFRRDHGDDARNNAAACARCHTQLSGNRRDTCDECHQVMRPQDHVVTWREYDHGPEAATESERCTTCHQVDFCVTCHRNAPRSHFPTLMFRSGGHGTQAVLNMRACVTCHRPRDDCSGAGCHRTGDM